MLMLAQSQYSEELATWMLFFSNVSIAFSDVIVDSLMVVQARRYPKEGSEELNAFCWTCSSVGGLLGSISAAVITQHYHPSYCFYFSSLMGLIIAYVSIIIPVSIENVGDTG